MNNQEHWDAIYQSKPDQDLSWTQPEPLLSLKLIDAACSSGLGSRVLDVGCGNSVLAERLLDRGYAVTVLDISAAALERAKKLLGARASQIHWIAADILALPTLESCDIWHDRAVFHFLTNPGDRAAYRKLLEQTIPVGGHVVMGTFALDGPQQCSGLAVQRYDGPDLAAELGASFALLKSEPEMHITPQGKQQSFQFSLFRRV